MTLEDFYNEIGGNYAYIISILHSEESVREYLAMYKSDKSYGTLIDAVATGDRKAIFLAGHALKGLAGCLSFPVLYALVNKLMVQLRNYSQEIDLFLIEQITEEYNHIIRAIDALD